MLDKVAVFCYDGIGNISSIATHDYTTGELGTVISTQSFSYDTTHKDRLTAFGSKAITYNANGEMASFDGWSYSWSKGKLTTIRQITTAASRAIVKPGLPTSSKTHSFTYNAFGQRTMAQYSYFVDPTSSTPIGWGETVNYTKKFFYDHAGRLMFETKTTTLQGTGDEYYEIAYLYDQSSMVGMELTKNNQSTLYYFQRNLLGDVVAIYDTNGTLKVRYIYDAWGNCTIASGSDMQLAYVNPIRYRGYYYDQDTGLYYLNARYCSPELRRFISPDDTAYLDPENANGLNLYVYCCNDPVNYCDPSGHFFTLAMWIGLGIGAVLGGIYGGVSAAANGQNILAGIAIGAVVGGLTGLITEAFSVPGILLSTFFVGAGGDVASQLLLDGKSWEEVNLVSAIWAGVANAGLALAGKGLSKIGEMAGLNATDSIIFGAMTNSPLLALGMTFNMIISMYAPTYTLGNLGTDALGKQLN